MITSESVPIRRPCSAAIAGLTSADHPDGHPVVLRVLAGAAAAARALRNWLATLPRRWGDRWFAMNDAEAEWRGWQMTRVHGGLGRRYRDPRFDTLAECAQCRGAGFRATVRCLPCLGTGRVTIRGVS